LLDWDSGARRTAASEASESVAEYPVRLDLLVIGDHGVTILGDPSLALLGGNGAGQCRLHGSGEIDVKFPRNGEQVAVDAEVRSPLGRLWVVS